MYVFGYRLGECRELAENITNLQVLLALVTFVMA